MRGRAKNPIIIIITPTWSAKIGAAAAVETPATCERRHLSLSDGKSTARRSSVVATPRTHGVCYIHIIVYALTEALGFLLNCIPDEKQNMHCIVGRLHPTFGCAFCKYLCLSGRLEELRLPRARTRNLSKGLPRHKVQGFRVK